MALWLPSRLPRRLAYRYLSHGSDAYSLNHLTVLVPRAPAF